MPRFGSQVFAWRCFAGARFGCYQRSTRARNSCQDQLPKTFFIRSPLKVTERAAYHNALKVSLRIVDHPLRAGDTRHAGDEHQDTDEDYEDRDFDVECKATELPQHRQAT